MEQITHVPFVRPTLYSSIDDLSNDHSQALNHVSSRILDIEDWKKVGFVIVTLEFEV
jgi:hypothetical protein